MNKTFTYPFLKKLFLLGLLISFSVAHVLGQAPVITSFSPSSGPVGTVVTVTGSGFAPAPTSNIVFFGATMATVTAATPTSLAVTVPVGATYQPISVLNSNTALSGYSAKPFIPTFSPSKGNITKDDFSPQVAFTTGGFPEGIAIGDLDGDGKPDLIIANNRNAVISVLRNTSVNGSINAGSFAPAIDIPAGSNLNRIAIGDLDGDGKPDIVVTGNGVTVYRNTSSIGSIAFAPAVYLGGNDHYEVVIADLDGDGKPEIITADGGIWQNAATRGLITASSFIKKNNTANVGTSGPGSHTSIAVSDLDGDGKPDIVVTNPLHYTVTVFHNNLTPGTWTGTNPFDSGVDFSTGNESPEGGDDPIFVKIADLDGDGKQDIVTTNEISNSMTILRNTSAPGSFSVNSFAPRVDFAIPLPWSVAIGDLDGDGKPDIAVVENANRVAIFHNTSTIGAITTNSFAPRVEFATGTLPNFIAIGDLDGDGKADIAITNSNNFTNGTVSVIRNNPLFPPAAQATNIVFTNTGQNSTTATWTNGNGTARAVFISVGTTGTPAPANSNTYTAGTVYASGTQIGSGGWYCVYNGTGNSVNISGLSSGATYRAMVVEYTGSPGGENYLTTPSTGNPANVTTLSGGPITVNSIDRVTNSTTNAATVAFAVTFASNVSGLTQADFGLVTTGNITGAGITSITGSGSAYTVTVNTGNGDGTIGLNLASVAGLSPAIISPLPFVGQVYTIDRTPPAITISDPSLNTMLSGASQVTYTITYTDANFNTSTLKAADITLITNGSATGIVSLSGAGTTYTVTISGITGSGKLGLSIAAGTASDMAGNTAPEAGPSPTFSVSPVLSGLTTNSGTLSPAFASLTTAYTSAVPNNIASLLVIPATTDPNASITVNGGSASTPVNLVVGLNTISIKVATLDGTSSTIYTIGVVRAAPIPTGLPPDISYGNGHITITSAAPQVITPANTGGMVPPTDYGRVALFAGSPSENSGYLNDTGTAAQFNWPQQAVMDAAGNLYVTDANNNAIRMITQGGVVTTFAGSLTGVPGFINGSGTSAQLNFPDGITIDAAGNLYVSDYNNNAIRKITATGIVSTLYVSNTAFGPGGLCMDAAGDVIVAAQDAGQIVKITPAGLASVFAGSTPGYANGPAASAQFNMPGDVKIDAAGNMYVADFENNAIRKITPAGIVSTIAGSDVPGNVPGFKDGAGTAAIFNNPPGLFIGPGGVIYVADIYNNDIRRIMPDGTVSLVAGNATQVPGDADGIGTAAGFNLPVYIYIDNGGTAYISELGGNRVRKMVLTGYTLHGTLPAGLVFDPATGIIRGRANIPFTSTTDTVTAYNAFGYSTTVLTFSYSRVSNIATLSDLRLDPGTLTPSFVPVTQNYSASEPNSVSSITVTPVATDTTATITVNGLLAASGKPSSPIPLKVGPNTITTIVTAQDGVTKDTYTVIVTRAASSDALLSNLTPNEGSLMPAFNSSISAYADTVSGTLLGMTVTPTAEDSSATIKVNDIAVTSGTASSTIPLFIGANTITVVVTAQDGTTTRTYTIAVYKGEPPSDMIANNVLTPNGDGKNDYWVIKDIELYPQNNVTVFDKGGRVVYAKRGYNNEWDGTLNGSPLAEGTYYFVVDLGPNLRKFKGFVCIIRN